MRVPLEGQHPMNENLRAAPNTRPASRITLQRAAVFLAIAVSVATLDQVTKWAVRANFDFGESWSPGGLGFVRIVHLTNSGAAFGIFQGQAQLLAVTSVIGIAAIVLYFLFPPADHPIVRVALAVQLGGALGNLLDRIVRGEVTDWIDVGTWPTFNLADSSITVSIVALLTLLLFVEGPNQEQDRAKVAAPPDQ